VKIAEKLDPRRLLSSLGVRKRAAQKPPEHTGPSKKINLALQGGGAHGAFTWGVLDHLLGDGRLIVEGISGTSAGAINAVMLADGLARGGPEEARKRLADFWRAASRDGNLTPMQRTALDRLYSLFPTEGFPLQSWFNAWSRTLSPYDFNPLNINPLKELIERFVDFDVIRASASPLLFVSATNVHTGRLRVFSGKDITADAIMASACLPLLFRAVEIDGVPYWDGGYMGNPALFPFFDATESEDVLIVQINPIVRRETPTSTRDILNRINEITFNSPLISEMRAINFVGRLIDAGKIPHGTKPGEYRRINVHRIVLDGATKTVNATTRLKNDFDFFRMLFRNGQRAARRFLDEHFDNIGVRSTVDISSEVSAERSDGKATEVQSRRSAGVVK
jgi:NTE family protein